MAKAAKVITENNDNNVAVQITAPLSSLKHLDNNPRKSINVEDIEELANSLLERQINELSAIEKKGVYYIWAGHRRLTAFEHLQKSGQITNDHPVRITVWDISEQDAFAAALTENIQRQTMSPIEECDGIQAALDSGISFNDLVRKTGLSRIRILNYSNVARANPALRNLVATGNRNIDWASKVSILSLETQETVLNDITKNPESYKTVELIEKLSRVGRIPVSYAIFDATTSGLTIETDLFDNASSYFQDNELFWNAQNVAIDNLKAELEEEGHDFVEIYRGRSFDNWNYTPDDNGKFAFIVVSSDGKVEIHRKLKHNASTETEEEEDVSHLFEAGDGTEEIGEQRSYANTPPSGMKANQLARIRVDATAYTVLHDKSLSKRVLLAGLMEDSAMEMGSHHGEIKSNYLIIAAEEIIKARHNWQTHLDNIEDGDAFSYTATLSDDTIDELIHIGTVLRVTNQRGKSINFNGPSIAKKINDEGSAKIRAHFTPDEAFLENLELADLRSIGTSVLPADKRALVGRTSKKDLVFMLAEYFREGQENALDPEYAEVNEWLPGYM
jgi:ParB/RepB/Spo0J family partition protein